MISEDLDLQELTQQLRAALGNAEPVGYLRGKSLMRNALVHEKGFSELDAEEVIDTLELRGFIKYLGDPSEPSQANAHGPAKNAYACSWKSTKPWQAGRARIRASACK